VVAAVPDVVNFGDVVTGNLVDVAVVVILVEITDVVLVSANYNAIISVHDNNTSGSDQLCDYTLP